MRFDILTRLIKITCFIALFIFQYSGCDSVGSDIVDPSIDIPHIREMTVIPDSVNTDTIFVNGEPKPDDLLTINWEINSVIEPREVESFHIHYLLTRQITSETIVEEAFLITPPAIKDTVHFNKNISMEILRSELGKYNIELFSVTETGLQSNKLIKTVTVVRNNQPPYIVSVDAPDTVYVPEEGESVLIDITVVTDDPDGVEDVQSVQFINIQPDGEVAGPFFLNKVSPGIFEITLEMTHDAKTGTHRFEFQAFDTLNEPSEVYIHDMEVI